MIDLGVYVGRFCPPHVGHKRVIQQLLADNGVARSLVIIGSSNSAISYRHLFSVRDRSDMLKLMYPGLNVVGIPDHINDELWIYDVLLAINCWRHGREQQLDRDITFYGGCEEDVLFFINAGHKVSVVNRFDGSGPKVSATEVRDALVHDRNLVGLVPDSIRQYVKTTFKQRWEELKQR